MLRIFQRTTGRVAGSISRRRRSRFAAPAVLLIGLLATGGVYAAFTPADAAKQDDATEVAKGKALFLVGCSSCHGMNGEGITTKRGKQLGPPLVGVGAAAVDFQVGTGRMPMAQPGVQAPRKKVLYSDEEISQLGAYVASLGPGPEVPAKSEYDVAKASQRERRPWRRDLPHQLHGVPQLRRLRRGAAPGQVRTQADRRHQEAHLRGPAHRSSADAGLLRRGAHA